MWRVPWSPVPDRACGDPCRGLGGRRDRRRVAAFDASHSWLVGNQRALSVGLALAAAAALLIAAVGLMAHAEWWRSVAVSGLGVSFVLMLAFFHPWFLLAEALNAACDRGDTLASLAFAGDGWHIVLSRVAPRSASGRAPQWRTDPRAGSRQLPPLRLGSAT